MGKHKKEKPLGRPRYRREIITIYLKLVWGVRSGLIRLRLGTGGGLLGTR
jgi:hypothetical protein